MTWHYPRRGAFSIGNVLITPTPAERGLHESARNFLLRFFLILDLIQEPLTPARTSGEQKGGKADSVEFAPMERVKQLQNALDQARSNKQKELEGEAREHVLASYDRTVADLLAEIQLLQTGIRLFVVVVCLCNTSWCALLGYVLLTGVLGEE